MIHKLKAPLGTDKSVTTVVIRVCTNILMCVIRKCFFLMHSLTCIRVMPIELQLAINRHIIYENLVRGEARGTIIFIKFYELRGRYMSTISYINLKNFERRLFLNFQIHKGCRALHGVASQVKGGLVALATGLKKMS